MLCPYEDGRTLTNMVRSIRMARKLATLILLVSCSAAQGSIYKVGLPEFVGKYTLDYSFDKDGYINIDNWTGNSSSLRPNEFIPADERITGVQYCISGSNDWGLRSGRGFFYTGPASTIELLYGNDVTLVLRAMPPSFEEGSIDYVASFNDSFLPTAIPDLISVRVDFAWMVSAGGDVIRPPSMKLDDAYLVIETVPEPGTVMLLGVGGLMGMVRRVRKVRKV
jgi:hypothetical protein